MRYMLCVLRATLEMHDMPGFRAQEGKQLESARMNGFLCSPARDGVWWT